MWATAAADSCANMLCLLQLALVNVAACREHIKTLSDLGGGHCNLPQSGAYWPSPGGQASRLSIRVYLSSPAMRS